MSVPVIAARGLVRSFGPTRVLDGLDLDVARGESLVVIGGSGAGKSVLLRCLLGLEPLDAGTVRLDGEVVRGCLVLAVQADGKRVDTVEGLSDSGEARELQDAFVARNALQCGFCTSGMLMAAQELVRTHPDATLIPVVERVTPDVWALAGGAGSHRGTGGMHTKIQAAEIATRAGTPVVVASGDAPEVLRRLVQGEAIGTRFLEHGTRLEARKRWILAEIAAGSIELDEGAARAVRERGGSLLPAGIRRVQGAFGRGHTVRLVGPDGQEVARGLSRYRSEDLALIAGRHSRDIEAVLGFTYGPEAVHRDDLVRL